VVLLSILADHLKRSHSERTRREDRRLNFYIERDNLPGGRGASLKHSGLAFDIAKPEHSALLAGSACV